MNHPYSRAASFQYAEEARPAEEDAPPKYTDRVPTPAPALPPLPHESGWLNEDPYADARTAAPARPLRHSHSGPLHPVRAAPRYQSPVVTAKPVAGWIDRLLRPRRPPSEKRAGSAEPTSEWVDDLTPEAARGSNETVVTPPTPLTRPPQHTTRAEKRAKPASGWVEQDINLESERSLNTSNETVVARPGPPTRFPQPKSTVIRYIYEGEEDPLIAHRPAPVPYEKRPSERALEARKHAAWRQKVIDSVCL
ncbi:hypothetical protein DFH06DRAFT_1314853 [Mycena polygramma]|nr:hypothetical protein DFH06DRAFT_1314853 [Mycena polygramma]